MNQRYMKYTVLAAVCAGALWLGGCKAAPAGAEKTEATPSEARVIQVVPETIAPLGLDGQVLPYLADVDLGDAEPIPDYLRIGVRHAIVAKLQA